MKLYVYSLVDKLKYNATVGFTSVTSFYNISFVVPFYLFALNWRRDDDRKKSCVYRSYVKLRCDVQRKSSQWPIAACTENFTTTELHNSTWRNLQVTRVMQLLIGDSCGPQGSYVSQQNVRSFQKYLPKKVSNICTVVRKVSDR